MSDTKAMTLRLPAELAGDLEIAAAVDGIPIAEAVRIAIGTYTRGRLADPAFAQRLRAFVARLEQLAEPEGQDDA